jgi:hypothetical protein
MGKSELKQKAKNVPKYSFDNTKSKLKFRLFYDLNGEVETIFSMAKLALHFQSGSLPFQITKNFSPYWKNIFMLTWKTTSRNAFIEHNA